ncbi:MAG: arylesterase [Salinisphaeraceae bacterium]|nr:arylesterase [Salinisphaeraceae bacterium]
MPRLVLFISSQLLLLLLLSGCGNDTSSLSLPALSADATILAFGDSITYGTGAKQDQSYPRQLANKIDRRVINAGVPGETTQGGLKRLPETLATTDPDLVILCLGGNDFLKRMDYAVTRSNLAAMLSLLKEQDIPVVMMAVPKFGIGVTGNLSAHKMYADLGKEFGVIVENDIISDVLSDGALKADPIHPNGKGYAEIADTLANLLAKHSAIGSSF